MADEIKIPTKDELDATIARWEADYINAQRLADCRQRPCERSTFKGKHGWLWSQVFCYNCGADGGLVKDEWASHVLYFCKKCEHWGRVLACLKPAAVVIETQHEQPMRGNHAEQHPAVCG